MASGGSGRQLGGPSDGDEAVRRPLIRGRPILEQIKLAAQMHNLRMQVEYLVAVTKMRQHAYGSEGTNLGVGIPGVSAAAADVAVAAVVAAAAARAEAAAAAESVNEAEGSSGNKQESSETSCCTGEVMHVSASPPLSCVQASGEREESRAPLSVPPT